MLKSQLNLKEGEIWYADLGATIGREQSGFRPILIASNDWYNHLENSLVGIVPITRRNRGLVHHIEVNAGNGGLPKDCVIMCDQLRSIDVRRLKKRQGSIEPDTLVLVRTIISRFFVGIPFYESSPWKDF